MALRYGDHKAVEIIVNTASVYLGQVVGALVNLLAPDQIVLGGGLVEAMPDIIVNTVTKTATKYAMPSLAKSFRVVPAKLGDDATAMGAAAWAQTVIEMAATQV